MGNIYAAQGKWYKGISKKKVNKIDSPVVLNRRPENDPSFSYNKKNPPEKINRRRDQETIFSEDFEGSFPGSKWSIGDVNGNSDYWGVVDCYSNNGFRSAWCSGTGYMTDCTYYQYYMDAYMLTNDSINLRDYSDINYYYSIYTDTYEAAHGDDYVAEYYSEDGINWIMGDFFCGYSGGWQDYWWTITNIDAYYIKFEFFSTYGAYDEEGVYVDDILITGNNQAVPNLVYNWESGWDYPVIVSSVPGTHTAADSLEIGETVYVDWSITNDGFAHSGSFYVALYLNNTKLNEWYLPELGLGNIHNEIDYPCIVNSTGFNEFRIEIDEDGYIEESDEFDNSWGWSYWFYEEPEVEYINYSGYVQFINKKTGIADTLQMLKLEIRDMDNSGSQVLDWCYTDIDGHFEFSNIDNTNDIEDGDGEKQDIFFRVWAEDNYSYVQEEIFGPRLIFETPIQNNHLGGSFDTLITIHEDVASPFYMIATYREGIVKWEDLVLQSPITGKLILTDDSLERTCYSEEYDIIWINNLDYPDWSYPDDWDRDVILHELGHRLESSYDFFDTSEGGLHSWNTIASKELAASEGFAHFWSGVVNNSPIQVNTWNNFNDSTMANMENGEYWKNDSLLFNFYCLGIKNEGTVASILWDIYDYEDDSQNPSTGGDSLSDGYTNIKEVTLYRDIDGNHPDDIEEFWEAWFNSPSLGYCYEMIDIWFDRGLFDIGCSECCIGMRGNADSSPDEDPNMADIVYMIDFLFRGGSPVNCPAEADVNDEDGPSLNVADIVWMVNYFFKGGQPPKPC
ncbi:MAG: CARDB domain-containing protein [Methanosarcinaceae archaeon]